MRNAKRAKKWSGFIRINRTGSYASDIVYIGHSSTEPPPQKFVHLGTSGDIQIGHAVALRQHGCGLIGAESTEPLA